MDRLFIIGNGFDLFHGIPSSYCDFEEYLQDRHDTGDFLEKIERFIESSNLWSDFERALGELDDESVRDYCSDQLVDYGSDKWRDSCNHDYQFEIESVLDFATSIPDFLNTWISELDTNIDRKLSKKILTKEDLYITFNYTDTLENVYNIPDNNINHIHGQANTYSGSLIVGHGNTAALNTKSIYDEDDDFRLLEGDELISGYWKATFKNVHKIIKKNSDLWSKLSNITEIYVLGHSLSEVDMPYFEHIQKLIGSKKCHWFVSYYEPYEENAFPDILEKVGVAKKNITPIKLEELYRNRIRKCLGLPVLF